MSMIKHIPNALTSMNLFSGCVACVFALMKQYELAALCIMMSACFDFFDGFAARMLKAYSEIGKELDSLADVVSFGTAPSMMLFSLLSDKNIGWSVNNINLFACSAFLIAVFSGLRLAKFNIDTRQTSSFIGLPVPANALFWCALITDGQNWLMTLPYAHVGLIILILCSSWILVSEIPMFSLKFKDFAWKTNRLRFTFLILAALLILLFRLTGLSLTIILYILLSVCNDFYSSHKRIA